METETNKLKTRAACIKKKKTTTTTTKETNHTNTQLTDWRILFVCSPFFPCGGGSSLTFMRLHTDIEIARNYFGQIRRNCWGNINARNYFGQTRWSCRRNINARNYFGQTRWSCRRNINTRNY